MWDNMTAFQQTFFVIAIVATVIMIILIIMMFIGMDEVDGFDATVDDLDLDVDMINDEPISGIGGLKILSIRGVLAFLSIGGWTTYLLSDTLEEWLALLIGIIAGSIAAVLLAYALKSAMRLESSGNLDYKGAVGKTAMVYIRIPALRNGRGKVIMNHQGKTLEVDALTDEKEDLLRNTKVIVHSLEDDSTLLVKNTK